MNLKINSQLITALFLFSLSLALSGFSLYHHFENKGVQALVKADIRKLQKTPNYSVFFRSIYSIEKFAISSKSVVQKNIEEAIVSNIETSKTGNYTLQIEMYLIEPTDLIEEKMDHDLWIIQYSFFDKKTKNKLSELSRSYIDKKK